MSCERPSISVVICTHNRCELLPRAVGSLLNQHRGSGSVEIIVVANACTDDTARVVEEMQALVPDGVRLRRIDEEKPGLSQARNRGLEEARSELIAYFDDDAEAQAGWLDAIELAFLRSPKVAVVGGPVVPLWPTGRAPGWLDGSIKGFFTILDYGSEARCLTAAHEWLAGTNIAFRRSRLLNAGGFSTRLGRYAGLLLSNEEIDATRRITAFGDEAWYCPAMRVKHHVHHERITRRWLLRRAFWQGISNALLDHPLGSTTPVWPHDREVNRLLLRFLFFDLLQEFFIHDVLRQRSRMPRLVMKAKSLGVRYATANGSVFESLSPPSKSPASGGQASE